MRATTPDAPGLTRHTRMRTLTRALASLAAGTGLVLASAVLAPSATAADGITITSTTRAVVEVDGPRVRMAQTVTLGNVTPDVRTAEGTRFYYWDSFSFAVPLGSTDISAVSRGQRLNHSVRTQSDAYHVVSVPFPSRLLYGQSRTIELSYVLPPTAPRSAGTTRVGPGYATFELFGEGDVGQTTLEVVAPQEMTFDATEGFEEAGSDDGMTTYRNTTSLSDGGAWAAVSLRAPDEEQSSTIMVQDNPMTLLAYPDDEQWLEFATEGVRNGIPALEGLTGSPWPGDVLTIRQDVGVEIFGWGGWYDGREREIVVSEDLDDVLLLHELSHAWANDDTLNRRWLSEGLTELLARRAASELGLDVEPPPSVDPADGGAVPLEDWSYPAGGISSEVDAYGYPASYQAMAELTADLDDEAFRAVVADVLGRTSAYGDFPAARTSARRMLDLIESREPSVAYDEDGTSRAVDIMVRWVLPEDDDTDWQQRADARVRYAAVDAADGAWSPPEQYRAALSRWDFPRAGELAEAIEPFAPAAAEVQEAAEDAGLPVPTTIRERYELAESDDFAAVAEFLPRAASTIDRVGAAVAATAPEVDPVTGLGERVLSVDDDVADAEKALSEADLTAAAALATEAITDAERATLVGGGIVGGAALVLLAPPLWLLARRRAHPSPVERP